MHNIMENKESQEKVYKIRKHVIFVCDDCGKSNKPHHGKGLCQTCYRKVYRAERNGDANNLSTGTLAK
jgi:NMD protein affecting ribosome stability and mRNA decay